MPLDYEYDVFVSYRRTDGSAKWVQKHFAPTLIECLSFELPRPPRVFFDTTIESGVSWPQDLGHKLACSRTLLCLWSKNYLQSEWCVAELSQMQAREADEGFRTNTNPRGLIFVGLIHDGEERPSTVKIIQSFDIQTLYNTNMRKDSKLAEKLENALKTQAPALAKLILGAPAFRPSWPATSAAAFYNVYRAVPPPVQTDPPTFTPP